MKHYFTLLSISLILIVLVACQPQAGQVAAPKADTEPAEQSAALTVEADEPTVITMMSHDSFNIGEEIIAEFEAEHGITIELLPSGDAGAALNQAILSKNNPLADIFFGVDNTFMSRALSEDVFEPYPSPLLEQVPDQLELDAEHRLLPVDFGDVCLNYDKAWFVENGVEPPDSLEDLSDPAYKSLTVVQNPATSSPGLAFLLATIGAFGEEGYQDYWQALRDNDVLVVNGWEEAYWGQFSAASDGDRPIVVSYASSPPVEVFFAETPLDEAPTAAVVAAETCFRQIEFIGILKGTEQRVLAEKFVDFMLSRRFQEDIPLQMFVFPANENAALPEIFTKYTNVPENPAYVEPEAIEANREAWIETWTEVVLR